MVKCCITGEYVDKKTAYYYIPEGKVKKVFYKNKEIYEQHMRDIKSEENIQVLINFILGKASYTKFTKQIIDKLNKLKNSYSLQEIEFSLELDKYLLLQERSKGLIYILQIVENRLIQNKVIYDKKNNLKTKKIEINDDIENYINDYKYKPKKYDVRCFVNE